MTTKQIMEDDNLNPVAARNMRYMSEARRYFEPKRERPDCRVALFYGLPGTGKSFTAREKLPHAFWKDNTQWWHMYAGQEAVVWDEFTGDSCTPTEFNRIFDNYHHDIEYKGDMFQLMAHEFIITSNWLPEEWWMNKKNVKVLVKSITRRIHLYCWFTEIKKPPQEFDNYEDFVKAVRPARNAFGVLSHSQ